MAPKSPKPLRLAIRAAADLQSALRELLSLAGFPAPRVRDLTGDLGIDKSTASRVLRGIRAADGADALREFPSGEGLRVLIKMCAGFGLGKAGDAASAKAERSVEALESAVKNLPGGRAGLLSALAMEAGGQAEGGTGGSSSEDAAAGRRAVSDRAARSARRAAFNSWSFLQGIWVESWAHGLYFAPGDQPGSVHQGMLHAMVGIRRLRPGPPITVAGVYGSPLTPGPPARATLSGDPIGDNPMTVLLPEFCQGPVDRLRVEQRDRSYLLWLDREDPPLDRPATIVHGMKYPNFFLRHASDRFHYASTNYTVRRPTRFFVLEMMVAAGLLAERGPTFQINMDPQRLPDPIGGPPSDGRETLAGGPRFVPMGRGFAKRGSARADAYLPMHARAFQRLGWNPQDFERYRVEIEYPLLFVGMQAWHELSRP